LNYFSRESAVLTGIQSVSLAGADLSLPFSLPLDSGGRPNLFYFTRETGSIYNFRYMVECHGKRLIEIRINIGAYESVRKLVASSGGKDVEIAFLAIRPTSASFMQLCSGKM
jgi:hypothetical protein